MPAYAEEQGVDTTLISTFMRSFLLTCASFFLLFSAGCSRSPQTSAITESISFTEDGAWCWFQDPRAVYIDGDQKRTYAGWMTSSGQLQIGSFDHESGETSQTTLKEDWDIDDHNTSSLLVLPDRRLAVFYARHNKEGLFVRQSTRAEDISTWDTEVLVSGTPRITYSHPVHLQNQDKYFVFWRGPSWKPTLSFSSDLQAWSSPRVLLQEEGREADDIRPYLKVVSDGASTIHFAFTNGHPRNEPANSLYYLMYQDSVFYSVDGKRMGTLDLLPIRISPDLLVYNAKQTGVRAWVWDIAIDDEGLPVIAYTQLPSESDHRYHYTRWNGQQWIDSEIVAAGPWFPQTEPGTEEREGHYSGGMGLNHANPSITYVSRQVAGQFEIEKWVTPDKGISWSSSAVTSHSDALNVRPVVPRGYTGNKDHVLWMRGDYVHYTNYQTGIQLSNGHRKGDSYHPLLLETCARVMRYYQNQRPDLTGCVNKTFFDHGICMPYYRYPTLCSIIDFFVGRAIGKGNYFIQSTHSVCNAIIRTGRQRAGLRSTF